MEGSNDGEIQLTSVPVAPTAPRAPRGYHLRRLRRFPVRRPIRRAPEPEPEPRAPPTSTTMVPGDILTIFGAVSSTIMALRSNPAERWFNPAQSLDSCVCSGEGETLLCPCLPTVFLIYEAWMTIFFCTFMWLFVRVLVRHGFWWAVPLYVGTMLPGYGWSVYQAIPRQFRTMVMWMDFGLVAATSLVMFLVWCFCGCRRRRTPTTVSV